eukprot:COSAG01_NODE_162_length_23597_cov_21.924130_21_plen_741_part_00
MFEHVKTVCHSADEKFVDPYDPVPSSCATLDCADAVRRAERECGPLLDKSGWFKTRKSQLAAAVHRCETAAVDPDRYVVQPPSPSGPMRGTVHTISSCRGTISDGEGKFDKCEYALLRALPGVHLDACWCARGLVASDGNNWKRFAKVDAGPGLHVKFELEMLDMGAGDVLILSDGEANTPLSECSRGMSAKCPRMISLKGQEIKPPGAYVSSGRYAYVTMLTDSSGSNLRGFRLRISCVCADSERWTATRQSSRCARFAKGAHQSLHSTCEAPPGGVAAQGVVRPWMDSGQSAQLALPAAVACPKACGKCEVDPCQHVRCQHGGQCVNMVTGAHGGCQNLEQFTSFETAVTSACCDEPGERCAGGAPQSCNSGCAKVFMPGYRACSGGFLKTHRKGYEAIKKTMDHVQQLCHGRANCPSGYIAKSGDKPGFGDSNAGGKRTGILQISSCGQLCNSNSNCKSFEWSPSELFCNLNNVGNPPSTTQYKDYQYCVQTHAQQRATCACAAGWTGAQCQTQAKKCVCANGEPQPGCGNGAHACEKCHNGYALNKARTACEKDPCHGVNCGAHGHCQGGRCACKASYKGTRCQTRKCPEGFVPSERCDTCKSSFIGEHCAAAFSVSGAKNREFNGLYSKTDRVCNGRPVYQQRGDGPLLYKNLAKVAGRRAFEWRIAARLSSNCVEASSQHEVTSEVYGALPRCTDSPDGCTEWHETITDVGRCRKPESNGYWCDDPSNIRIIAA